MSLARLRGRISFAVDRLRRPRTRGFEERICGAIHHGNQQPLNDPGCDQTRPVTDGEEHRVSSSHTIIDSWIRWATGGLLLLSLVVQFYPGGLWLTILRADWPLILPALHLLITLSLIAAGGRPARYLPLVTATGLIVATAVLWRLQQFELVLLTGVRAGLRIGLVVVWTYAVIGVFLAARNLRSRRQAAAKWWLVSVAILLTAEPVAAYINWRRERLPFPESLPDPAPNELRIAALGGSSTLGSPYEPDFGFPHVLRWRLAQHYPQYEVILENLAGPGFHLRRAILELNRMKTKPHLLLLYTGHNEFFHELEEMTVASVWQVPILDQCLEYSPAYRLIERFLSERSAVRQLQIGQAAFIEPHLATPAVYRRRLKRFGEQLQQLHNFCDRHEIAQVWFVPASSESGFAPNRSVVAPGTTTDECRYLWQAYQQARNADGPAAITEYQTLLSEQPRFAEFHFRLAECLRDAGRYNEAQAHFELAIDCDGHPIRANCDFRAAIARVAFENGILLVDTPSILRMQSPNGILGNESFHDNVHMTLRGYYATGMKGCRTVLNSRDLRERFGPPAEAEPPQFADVLTDAGMDAARLSRAYRRTAGALQWLQRWRFQPTHRESESARYARMADEIDAGKIVPGEGGTESLK